MTVALRNALICLPLMCLGGCSWFPYLVENVVGEPLNFTECCCFHVEVWMLADHAWKDVVAEHPESRLSLAYADGFHHGFTDYVNRNDSGEPPASPPCRYRLRVLRTPEQQQRIDDWFAGFRHGAEVARVQGWRDGVVVPIARPPIIVMATFKQEIIPTPSADLPAPPLNYEELPWPRPPVDKPPPMNPPPVKDSVWLGLPGLAMPGADDRAWILTGMPSLGRVVDVPELMRAR